MISRFGELVFSIRLFNTSESVGEIQLGENATSDQEPDTISRCPVGETMLDSVALEFVGVSGIENLVACDLGSDDLTDDIFVGEADDEAVFGSIVLVLGLSDETLAGIVVGLSCATTLILGLVATVLQSERGYSG